jgi:hypothetical protein
MVPSTGSTAENSVAQGMLSNCVAGHHPGLVIPDAGIPIK